jgi:cytochrome c
MKTTKLLAFGIAAAIAATSGAAMADGGEDLFKKKCGSCHSVEPGKHKIGPSLAGVMGRTAGTAEGYTKYKAMKGASFTWDDATMDAWITDQKSFLKDHKDVVGDQKTAMSAKIKKPEERAAIIEYLKAGHD